MTHRRPITKLLIASYRSSHFRSQRSEDRGQKRKGYFSVFCLLLSVFCLGGEGWGGEVVVRPEIVLHLEPKRPQAFQPTSDHNRPTHFILELVDAVTGIPLPEAVRMELYLVHVKGWGLLSTGFPHVEGKEQLSGTFLTSQGRLEIDYLFPVRGLYRLTVRCRPEDPSEFPGSVWPVSRSWTISVAEQPGNVRNAQLFLAGLLLFGLGIGLVFSFSPRSRGDRGRAAARGSVRPGGES